MSRSRHMKRAAGGRTKETVYAGAGSNVLKEAEERKRGGKVHGEGEKSKHRADKRARGGHVSGHPKHHADGGEAHHSAMHKAPGRKRGGGIGANLTPLSTAAGTICRVPKSFSHASAFAAAAQRAHTGRSRGLPAAGRQTAA